jgi:hypothetical protein
MLLLTLTLLAAIVLGMRHATDADHVVAVSTILSRERSVWRASRVGIMWGAGHTATVALAGVAIVAFNLAVPEGASHVLEGIVGVMLIVLGVRSLANTRFHGTAGVVSPFVVGAVHGLAGSAAFALLLIPLLSDPMWAAAYVLAFGAGTVVGMTVLTFAIAGSTLYAARRVVNMERWVRVGAGTLSVGFGAFIVLRSI